MVTREPEKARRMRKAGAFGPSVREVCLLGTARPATPCIPGARVEWEGRTYRVEATGPIAGEGVPHYVHLTTEVGDGA